MKNKILVLILGIFLISLVSSATINDYKSYDEQTKTALIKESALGDTKLELELQTSQNEAVGIGRVKIAEARIKNLDSANYTDIVELIEAYDISGGDLIEKEKTFYLKYRVTYIYEEPIYEIIEKTSKNGTVYTEQNITGYNDVYIYGWEDFTSNTILKGQELILSIWTDTYEGEHAEWIPTFNFGKSHRISEWASWTASLTNGGKVYIPFNESSGTNAVDYLNNFNGTHLNTPTLGVSGKYQNAIKYALASSEMTNFTSSNGNAFLFGNGDFGINMWVNFSSAPGATRTIVSKMTNNMPVGAYPGFAIMQSATNGVVVYVDNNGSSVLTVSQTLPANVWAMLTVMRSGSNLSVWYNGTYMASATSTGYVNSSDSLKVGWVQFANYYDSGIDELFIRNTSFSTDEIATLYDSGTGTFCPTFGCVQPDIAPVISLNLPVNNTNLTVSTYNFNGTVYDGINLTNVSFKLDGIIISTNSSGLNNSLYNFQYTGLTNGWHNWSLIAYDNSSQLTESTIRTFNVSVTAPIVTLQSPVTQYNTTSQTNSFIGFVTSPDTLVNVSLVQNGTTITATTNTSGLNNTNYTFSGTFPDGTHTWNIIACDTQNDCGSGTTRTINIDTVDPLINITSPTGTYAIFESGDTLDLNYSISDSNLDKCWYIYDSNPVYLNCTATSTNFSVNGVNTSLTVYANDTFGNIHSNTTNWSFGVFIDTVDYSQLVYETSNEEFFINGTVDDGANAILGYFYYDGTQYETDILTSGNTWNATSSINIPLGVDYNPLFWELIVSYDSGDIEGNTTIYYQNVTNISLTDCSSGNISLFFTSKSEINQTTMNDLDFDGTFWYWLGEGDIQKNVSISKSGVTNVSICFNLLGAANYSLDADITYSATSYSTRNYYYDNSTISSRQNITLYSLDELESTSFIVTLKDENYFAIPEALVYFKRWYAGNGTSETIGMIKTDDDGVSVIPLQEDIADYDIIVIKDGEILYTTTDHQKVYCTSTPCTYPIVTSGGEFSGWIPIGQVNNLEFSDITLNETSNIVSIDYADTSGGISYFRLVVYSEGPAVGRVEICDTNSTSSAATLTCNVTGYTGTLYAQAYLSRSPESLVWAKTFFLNTIKDIVGTEGLFLGLFILMIVGFGGALVGGPTGGILGVIVAVIFIPLLQIASFGPVFIWGIIIGGIFLIWNLKG